MEADDTHTDDKEESKQAPVGTFTVEARAEGVGAEFAGVLAVELARLGLEVRVRQVDITPKRGEP